MLEISLEANAINFFNESCQALGILDVKEYCRKYLINLYGESIYSK